jgi:hypothetical protein
MVNYLREVDGSTAVAAPALVPEEDAATKNHPLPSIESQTYDRHQHAEYVAFQNHEGRVE